MENSIENTWKQGFLQEQALVAPRLNRLYEQKSTHLVDRLLRLGRRNIIGIYIGAALVLIGFTAIGSWWAGVALFLILAGLAFYSQKEGQKLAQLDKGSDSYTFLRQLHNCLQDMSENYVRIYRWLYPALILAFGFGLLYSDLMAMLVPRLQEQLPNFSFTGGIPSGLQYAVVLMALVFGLFARRIYQEDVGLIYGPLLNKLQEMLEEMQELRA